MYGLLPAGMAEGLTSAMYATPWAISARRSNGRPGTGGGLTFWFYASLTWVTSAW